MKRVKTVKVRQYISEDGQSKIVVKTEQKRMNPDTIVSVLTGGLAVATHLSKQFHEQTDEEALRDVMKFFREVYNEQK